MKDPLNRGKTTGVCDNLRMRTFTLEYWIDDNWYVGRLKEVPGVFSQAQTLDQLRANILDAYCLMLQDQGAPVDVAVRAEKIQVQI